jgi:hypothetical protein
MANKIQNYNTEQGCFMTRKKKLKNKVWEIINEETGSMIGSSVLMIFIFGTNNKSNHSNIHIYIQ